MSQAVKAQAFDEAMELFRAALLRYGFRISYQASFGDGIIKLNATITETTDAFAHEAAPPTSGRCISDDSEVRDAD